MHLNTILQKKKVPAMETKAAGQDMRWYAKFTEKVGRGGVDPKQVGDVPDGKEHVRGFDEAEAMEAVAGLA